MHNEKFWVHAFFPVSLLPKSRSHIQGSSVTQVESVSPAIMYIKGDCFSISANTALHQGATAEPIAFRKGITGSQNESSILVQGREVEIYWMQNRTRISGLHFCRANDLGAWLHMPQFILHKQGVWSFLFTRCAVDIMGWKFLLLGGWSCTF